MDFHATETQKAVTELAGQILADMAGESKLDKAEEDGSFYLDDAWAALAEAQLTGVTLPEDVGGNGWGLLELFSLLEQVGRHVAPVPALETLQTAAAIDRFGSAEQRQRWLPGVVDGSVLLATAFHEHGTRRMVAPTTFARKTDEGYRLNGRKVSVPLADRAARILAPVIDENLGVGLVLIDPSAENATLAEQRSTHGQPLFALHLHNVLVKADDVLVEPGPGGDDFAWLRLLDTVARCAIQHGVGRMALDLTSEFARTREQFGAAIGSFQAVRQRAADAWIDASAMEVTLWQAAWRLSEGRPAKREAAIASFWACEGGQRITEAAQHLHGGMGFDRDYPLHRCFLWSSHLNLELGGANARASELGDALRSSA